MISAAYSGPVTLTVNPDTQNRMATLMTLHEEILEDAEHMRTHYVCSLKLAGRRAHIMSKRPIR
jgi:hypothetical protein